MSTFSLDIELLDEGNNEKKGGTPSWEFYKYLVDTSKLSDQRPIPCSTLASKNDTHELIVEKDVLKDSRNVNSSNGESYTCASKNGTNSSEENKNSREIIQVNNPKETFVTNAEIHSSKNDSISNLRFHDRTNGQTKTSCLKMKHGRKKTLLNANPNEDIVKDTSMTNLTLCNESGFRFSSRNLATGEKEKDVLSSESNNTPLALLRRLIQQVTGSTKTVQTEDEIHLKIQRRLSSNEKKRTGFFRYMKNVINRKEEKNTAVNSEFFFGGQHELEKMPIKNNNNPKYRNLGPKELRRSSSMFARFQRKIFHWKPVGNVVEPDTGLIEESVCSISTGNERALDKPELRAETSALEELSQNLKEMRINEDATVIEDKDGFYLGNEAEHLIADPDDGFEVLDITAGIPSYLKFYEPTLFEACQGLHKSPMKQLDQKMTEYANLHKHL